MDITLTAWEIITKQPKKVPLKDLLRLLPIDFAQKINKRIKTTEYLPEKPFDREIVLYEIQRIKEKTDLKMMSVALFLWEHEKYKEVKTVLKTLHPSIICDIDTDFSSFTYEAFEITYICQALTFWESEATEMEGRGIAHTRILDFLKDAKENHLDLSDLYFIKLPPIFDRSPFLNRFPEVVCGREQEGILGIRHSGDGWSATHPMYLRKESSWIFLCTLPEGTEFKYVWITDVDSYEWEIRDWNRIFIPGEAAPEPVFSV